MSAIIQKVSYKKEDAKQLSEKFGELLGIHRLEVVLKGGDAIKGVVSEVGIDYIVLIENEFDVVVPLENILYFRHQN